MGLNTVSPELKTTMTHVARLVRHAGLSYTNAQGKDGLELVRSALDAYWNWRISQVTANLRSDATLPDVVRNWGTAELLAVNPAGWGELRVSPTGLSLHIHASPEWNHLKSYGTPAFAEVYYGSLMEQLIKWSGLKETATTSLEDGGLRIDFGDPARSGELPSVGLTGPEGLALLKASSEIRGGLIVFLGRLAEEAFGADGEEMFRDAIRGFGAERGHAMRLDHLSMGLKLDLVNMLELYDSGGNEDVWQYKDEGVLTKNEWSQDCTFCPFVSAWKSLDGLRYGEIYDHEFHFHQFKAYSPDIEVRWGELQSRGDSTCEFRFTMKKSKG